MGQIVNPESRTAAATAAKQTADNVDSKTLATKKKQTNQELAKTHKVPQRKLQDAATVLEAAEKAPEGSPLKVTRV